MELMLLDLPSNMNIGLVFNVENLTSFHGPTNIYSISFTFSLWAMICIDHIQLLGLLLYLFPMAPLSPCLPHQYLYPLHHLCFYTADVHTDVLDEMFVPIDVLDERFVPIRCGGFR